MLLFASYIFYAARVNFGPVYPRRRADFTLYSQISITITSVIFHETNTSQPLSLILLRSNTAKLFKHHGRRQQCQNLRAGRQQRIEGPGPHKWHSRVRQSNRTLCLLLLCHMLGILTGDSPPPARRPPEQEQACSPRTARSAQCSKVRLNHMCDTYPGRSILTRSVV